MKIAVIGAGITGITTAYSLAKRGVEVVVYDENLYTKYTNYQLHPLAYSRYFKQVKKDGVGLPWYKSGVAKARH
jgi:flavin-dependent dehydrogenase